MNFNNITYSTNNPGQKFGVIKFMLFFILFIGINGSKAFSQKIKQVTVLVSSVFNQAILQLNDTTYFLNEANSFKFETFKFYISSLELLNNGTVVFKEKNSFHLYDASQTNNNFQLTLPQNLIYNSLQFNLGIDSVTNVSGVMGGDLDPTKGMYWAWQSGYINFKLEGKSNLSLDPKKEFQYHLGGYQHPFNALKTVSLAISQSDKIEILFDLKQFLNTIDLKKINHIMSPNATAIELSEKAVKCFSID